MFLYFVRVELLLCLLFNNEGEKHFIDDDDNAEPKLKYFPFDEVVIILLIFKSLFVF
jgi:hypothetical protein